MRCAEEYFMVIAAAINGPCGTDWSKLKQEGPSRPGLSGVSRSKRWSRSATVTQGMKAGSMQFPEAPEENPGKDCRGF